MEETLEVTTNMEEEFSFPDIKTWTSPERKKLLVLVNYFIENNLPIDWSAVSVHLSKRGRTAMDCFQQYSNFDDPKLNNGPWTKEEESNLLSLASSDRYQECYWPNIAEDLNSNRSPWQCFQHYQQVLNSSVVKTSEWSESEDRLLKDAVSIHGKKNWKRVAELVPGRSSYQCNLRYRRSLICNDQLTEGKWSPEDENRLRLAAVAFNAPLMASFKKTKQEICDMKVKLGLIKGLHSTSEDSHPTDNAPLSDLEPTLQSSHSSLINHPMTSSATSSSSSSASLHDPLLPIASASLPSPSLPTAPKKQKYVKPKIKDPTFSWRAVASMVPGK